MKANSKNPSIVEMMDVVDKKDQVQGELSQEDIYKFRKLHRIVHVLVYNNKGELALQLRSKYKSYLPLYWSTPVGGHVQKGESYELAALREAEEELGAKLEIELINKFYYKDYIRKLDKFLGVFKATYNGLFKLNPKEVKDARFFSLEKIRQMIENKDKIHPELYALLEALHFGKKGKISIREGKKLLFSMKKAS